MPLPVNPEAPAPAAVPAAVPAAAPTPDEDFASAFDEAVAADLPKVAEDTSAADEATSPVPVAPAAETPPAETAPPETSAAPAAEEPPAETPEAKIARLEAENAALQALKHAPAAPAAPQATAAPAPTAEAPAAPAAAPAAPPEPVWYQPSEEERTVLTELEKNWPDIAQAQNVAIKQAVYNAVQYTFNQIQKTYNPTMQRFAELSEVMSEQLALSALRGEHADYDEVYDNVVTWVDTLPGPFKAGAKLTMKEGTPEEVAELISEYKRTHPGITPAAAAPAAPAAPVTGKTELSAAAKQAASRLRVVGSKRTTPVTTPDPNDFDGAWAEAMRSGS